jgi:chorismate mutase
MSEKLQQLQSQLNGINRQLLHGLNEQARTTDEIVRIKKEQGISEADPNEVEQTVNELTSHNPGPRETRLIFLQFRY